MLSLIILVLCAIPAILVFLKYRWDKEDEALGLTGPPTKILVGNSLDLNKASKEDGDLQKLLFKWIEKYGPLFRFRAAHVRGIVIADPKVMEMIANNPKVGKPFTYKFFRSWLGDSMVITNGERWFKLRKLVTPSFHFQILEDFVKIFDSESKTLVSLLAKADGKMIDIAPYLARFAMDVICATAMGIKGGAQEDDATTASYRKACVETLRIIDERILNPLYFSDTIYKMTPAYKKETHYVKIIHNFVDNVIEQRRNEIVQKKQTNVPVAEEVDAESAPKKRPALLDILLHSNMDGKPLTNDDIRGEVNTFMFAGHDTTTSASQFFLYLMAKHPDAQEKLFEEIKHNVIDASEPMSMRLINSLVYLDLCVKESLRMYPPIASVGKCAEEPIKVGNVTIPAGDILLITMSYNHRNPKYFPEPDRFMPERFSEEITTAERNPYVYTPFSFGLRNCIGQRFAVLEIKTMLINILSKFKVELGYPGFTPDLDYKGILKSRNGMQLKFVLRSD